ISLTTFDKSISAAGGIFFKTNVRKLTNMLGKYVYEMQDPCSRQTAASSMATASISSVALGLMGNYFQWFSSTLGRVISNILLVPTDDMLARNIKASINLSVKENKKRMESESDVESNQTSCEQAITVGKNIGEAAGFSASVLATSLAVGQMDPSSKNAGLVAA